MKSKRAVILFSIITLLIVLFCAIRFSLSPVVGFDQIDEYINVGDGPIEYKWQLMQESKYGNTIVTCFEDTETGNEYLVFKELNPHSMGVQGVQLIERDMTVRKEDK